MLKTIVAIFVILHGLTHSIMAMVPSPNAPDAGVATFFSGIGSWLFTGLSESASKTIATTLAVIATLGFVAAGLALFGVLVPFDWWRALAIASAAVSLLLVLRIWNWSKKRATGMPNGSGLKPSSPTRRAGDSTCTKATSRTRCA